MTLSYSWENKLPKFEFWGNKLKIFIKFLFSEIVYSGHLQILSSVAIVIFTTQILDIKITWDLWVIVYLLFYFIYISDRRKGISVDALTNPQRTKYLKKISKYIPYFMVLDLLILIIFSYYFGNIYFWIFILSILGIGYLYPLYFKKLTKRIPLFKNLFVTSVFTALIFAPLIYYSTPINKKVGLLIISLGIFIFVRGLMMQIFLDLKDIKSDKKEGLLTLPVLIKKKKVFGILTLMIITTPLFLPILSLVHPNLFPVSTLFLLFLIPINLYYLFLIKNEKHIGFILESSEFIPFPFLIYLGNLIL